MELNADQLAALHNILEDANNFWQYTWRLDQPKLQKAFVFIKSCKGQGNNEAPVPRYDVVLEVVEVYHDVESARGPGNKTPLDRLEAVFNAVDLFPRRTE